MSKPLSPGQKAYEERRERVRKQRQDPDADYRSPAPANEEMEYMMMTFLDSQNRIAEAMERIATILDVKLEAVRSELVDLYNQQELRG